MILRASSENPARVSLAEAAGLTHFGAHVETLQPGQRASSSHWHETSEELLYVLAGEVTVVERGVDHVLGPGDAAAWPAGTPVGHHVVNRSAAACTYLIIGTRMAEDVVHYPDLGRELHDRDGRWTLRQVSDGAVLREGTIDQPRPLTAKPHK